MSIVTKILGDSSNWVKVTTVGAATADPVVVSVLGGKCRIATSLTAPTVDGLPLDNEDSIPCPIATGEFVWAVGDKNITVVVLYK